MQFSEQQTAHPDASLTLVGDFNHADPKTVVPKLHRHMDFPTCGNNTLDSIQFNSIQFYLYSFYYNTNCLYALYRDPEHDPRANIIN